MTESQPGHNPRHEPQDAVDGEHDDVLDLLGMVRSTPARTEGREDNHGDNQVDTHEDGGADGCETVERDEALTGHIETIAFEALCHGLHDSRVSALLHVLGWPEDFSCFVVAGTPAASYATVRRTILAGIRNLGGKLQIMGRHGSRVAVLVAVQGAATPEVTCTAVSGAFDEQHPVCLVPANREVAGACRGLHAAFSALDAAAAVHTLPRPMRADDVLPERALLGDATARDELYTAVFSSLLGESPDDPTLSTISAFIDSGGSLDMTARELNVHPNTVRYRLKRAAETTGWDATDPREAFVLRTAIAVGRMRDAS